MTAKLVIQHRVYAVACLVTIAAGLASRHFASVLPGFVGKYAGDALYASMAFFGISFFWNEAALSLRAVLALLYCFAIEFSQRYHAPWIDDIRHTLLGGLVLGREFVWDDLTCYTCGVAAAVVLELIYRQILWQTQSSSDVSP